MPFETLTDEEEKELYRLQCVYGQEALRCDNPLHTWPDAADAWLRPGDDSDLMVNIYSDQAEQTGNVPTKKGKPKPLLEWQFVEFLRVAIRAVVVEVTVLKPGERVQWHRWGIRTIPNSIPV